LIGSVGGFCPSFSSTRPASGGCGFCWPWDGEGIGLPPLARMQAKSLSCTLERCLAVAFILSTSCPRWGSFA
jgi:hypothetical protein